MQFFQYFLQMIIDTQDLQAEMYWKIDRDHVHFDELEGYEKETEILKKSLCLFEHNSKDSFYNAILYGLFSKLSQNKEKKSW